MKRGILPIDTVKVDVGRACTRVLRVVIELLNQFVLRQTTMLSVLECTLHIRREILREKGLLKGVRHFKAWVGPALVPR